MADFLIDDASVHFAASKSPEYRAQVRARFSALVGFLRSNGLLTRELLMPSQAPDESLKIMKSDLTDEGFLLIQRAYPKLLRGIDQGKAPSDVSLLEMALRRMRK